MVKQHLCRAFSMGPVQLVILVGVVVCLAEEFTHFGRHLGRWCSPSIQLQGIAKVVCFCQSSCAHDLPGDVPLSKRQRCCSLELPARLDVWLLNSTYRPSALCRSSMVYCLKPGAHPESCASSVRPAAAMRLTAVGPCVSALWHRSSMECCCS